MKFFNREKEIKKILSIIKKEPQLINFIYGPINSGKTTLINEIIVNRLSKDKYEVIYINLRGRFIEDYKSFIKVLFSVKKESFREKIKNFLKSVFLAFPKSISRETIKKASSGILEGIPVAESLLEKFLKKDKIEDVFVFLENYFEKVKEKGKIPILIIDELQVIGDLKINGLLIYKLFNFFIHLTKEKHLAPVFCVSSDSLFIEKIYNEGKLESRADYILVDDFEEKEAKAFMDLYAKEVLKRTLKEEEKEKIYNFLGGKPLDIVLAINKMEYDSLDNALNLMLEDKIQKIYMLLDILEYGNIFVNVKDNKLAVKKEKVLKLLKLFKENMILKKQNLSMFYSEYIYLIQNNILFLEPIKGILKPQSKLIWNAIKKVVS